MALLSQKAENADAMEAQMQNLHEAGLLKYNEHGLVEAVRDFNEHQQVMQQREAEVISAKTL